MLKTKKILLVVTRYVQWASLFGYTVHNITYSLDVTRETLVTQLRELTVPGTLREVDTGGEGGG